MSWLIGLLALGLTAHPVLGQFTPNSDQRSAYMFVKPGGGWINMNHTAKLTASDGAPNDRLDGRSGFPGTRSSRGPQSTIVAPGPIAARRSSPILTNCTYPKTGEPRAPAPSFPRKRESSGLWPVASDQ